jgi:hypothetical protein
MGRHEDNGRGDVYSQRFQDTEPIAARDLHIQEEQGRSHFPDNPDGVCARTAFAQERDLRIGPQKIHDIGPRQRLIVDDDGRYGIHAPIL